MTFCASFLLRACAGASAKIPLALVIALGVGASGCQDKASAPPEQSAQSAPSAITTASAAPSPEKAASPSAAASAEAMVIKSMDVGDRACYVALENAQGQGSDEMASFEICEQVKLIGQRVYLKREPAAIMAMSCEGNPQCAQTETVNLIVAAEKAP